MDSKDFVRRLDTEPDPAADVDITSLLPGLREGDAAATQAAWEQFFANLCRVAQRTLTDGRVRAADEEDAALSAFASVCRRLQRGDYPTVVNRDDLYRLLVTVTRRKAATLLRAEARKKRGGGKVSGESVFGKIEAGGGNGIQSIASADPSPEFIVLMADTVSQMFQSLEQPTRDVAYLKLQGYSNEEIGERLGRSVATVERRLKLIRTIWSSMIDGRSSDDV